MILNNVTLTDFGTFGGQQTIDLRPRPERPIILFGGKNGVGKTTLLEAVRLCFYGAQWNGNKMSRDQYSKYLDGRIHRNPTSLIQANSASVDVEFEFADRDGKHCYKVTRGWERKPSGRIEECLLVQRDGKALDEVTAEYWHEFVRDLLPLGISQLFFFDGERIQQLAEDGSDQQTLSEAIKLLLGVDLIERLNADLSVYVSRTAAETRRDGDDLAEFKESQAQADQFNIEITNLNNRASQLRGELEEARLQASLAERMLSSTGATFAKNRDGLTAEQRRIATELKQVEESVRELCGGLLPFALVPELCTELRKQLLKESEAEKIAGAKQVLSDAQARILASLRTLKLDGKKIPSALHGQITKAVITALDNSVQDDEAVVPIHQLSSAESRRLLSWLEIGVPDAARVVTRHSSALEGLHREQNSIESQLSKIPADDQVRPLLEDLKFKYQKLATVQNELAGVEALVEQTNNKLTEAKRKLDKVADKISARAANETRLQVVPKVRAALDEFKSLLILRKVRELEIAVTTCFNVLCRKKDNMRRIAIDPCSFAVTVIDRDGQPIAKSQLSAGEKQVYAISMLWALARTSRRPLPIIIDTPLARLDRDHRQLLAEHYFPHASHQVLMLSTDTEVDESYFEALGPNISHAYLLEFSPEERFTSAKAGYFWRTKNEAYQVASD